MAELSNNPPLKPNPDLAGKVSLVRWFGFYALLLAIAAVPLAISIQHNPVPFQEMGAAFAGFFKALGPALGGKFAVCSQRMHEVGPELQRAMRDMTAADKLLILGIYLSLCTTFTPLPTGWIVAAVAVRGVAVMGDLWSTVAAVSLVAAVASTVANLNDYHLFLALLRSRRVAKIRNTRAYHAAEKWFAKGPFSILVIFNFIPFPVDVARMLAAIYGYGRLPFAAANFVGRLGRYAIITAVTFLLGATGWVAPVALLGVAVLLAAIKGVPVLVKRLGKRGQDRPATENIQ